MAAKTVLTAEQQRELQHALQVAVLDALLASRRWQPGELVFQGGTSLHLMHGSPRFSEDLDFLVQSTLDLGTISESIHARLQGTSWLPRNTGLKVSAAKDGHNPYSFLVSVGGPDVIGAVRVKVELWRTSKDAMTPLRVAVESVRVASGPAAGARAFVPRADLIEIFADKVFAVGARPYLKPRDLFDIHWILERNTGFVVGARDFHLRLATYPNETPSTWLVRARDRVDSMPAAAATVATDLRRWLPSSWTMEPADAQKIIAVSIRALQQGIEVMQGIASSEPQREAKAPGERTTTRPRGRA